MTQFCFYEKYFRQIRLFKKKFKKLILPTYPYFEKHVTENTHIFFCLPLLFVSDFRNPTKMRTYYQENMNGQRGTPRALAVISHRH